MRRTERPVQTRFRCAYTYRLKLARHTKSLTHYTKGTPSALRPPTACRQPVSGSISLPLSGCFSPFPHGTCSLSVMHEYLESVRKVIQFEQSLLSMRRMDANLRKASALRDMFSKSLASLRQRPSHAKVLSTTQRLGKTSKPLAVSERLTISVARPGMAFFCPLAKTGP